jgi:hypothetical protein
VDRRSFIGLALISVIIFLVLLWSGNNQKKNAPAKARYEQKLDSARTAEDSIRYAQQDAYSATATRQDSLSALFPAMNGTENVVFLDNGSVRIGISSKGAAPCFA